MKTQEKSKRVCVVGGGAAGLMSAISASENGALVTLYEKNRSEKKIASEEYFDNAYLGKKLLITGKGRCNVANASEIPDILKHIPQNPKFMYASLYSFPPEKLMSFFEENGCPLKIERGNRVFPVSDKALDILKVLKNKLRENGVKIVNKKIVDVKAEDGHFVSVTDEDGKEVFFDACIVCTGGLSYPVTGSDGDGYTFARNTGHTVTDTYPSLVPLTSNDSICKALQGLSLKNITLSVYDTQKKKVIFEKLGEMLFTHYGVSGPLVLSASSHMRKVEDARFILRIDLKSALDEKTLDERLLSEFSQNPNKDLQNVMAHLLPSKMVVPFIEKCSLSPSLKVNGITKEQRRKLLETLKCFEISVSGTRPIAEAVITSGGVSVKDINPSTMESKLVKNLYFAGEVIDVDAYTGGYNLQIAFSSGYLAGSSAFFRRKLGKEL